jgi:glycosyltransferase involved in cell wall biosynthesis
MRIGINARFLLANRLEGIGRYSYEIVKRMVEQHPEDEFVFFFDRPYDPSFLFSANVIPVVITPPARHPILWYIWFEISLPSALRKHKVDVFFSPDGYLSLRSNVPTLMTIHDIAFVHFPDLISGLVSKYYRYFTPKFLAKAKKIAAVSNFTKHDLIQNYQISAAKIEVIYNGCQSNYQPLSIENQILIKEKYSEGCDYFFFVGAVHPRKNVHRLITAFDEFKRKSQSDIKLLIAGRFAWQTGEVKTAFDNSPFQKDIVFLGFVSDIVLPQLMASAFALTYISQFEGFGIPLLEAMNCEIPILTSNVSSLPEVVGAAGLCVNPYDISGIADGMLKLYRNHGFCLQLIEEAKQQRKHFDWNKSAEKVYRALQYCYTGTEK